MASLILDPEHSKFADELVAEFREQGIVMTPYAETLLRYSVEAFLEDTPQGSFYKNTSVNLKTQAKRIVEIALRDDHFKKRKRARFNDMMVALSDAGSNVLRDMIDKGF